MADATAVVGRFEAVAEVDWVLAWRAEHRAMNAAFAKQNERRVAHLKNYIARFGHGAKNLAKVKQSAVVYLADVREVREGQTTAVFRRTGAPRRAPAQAVKGPREDVLLLE